VGKAFAITMPTASEGDQIHIQCMEIRAVEDTPKNGTTI